jgi:hypothetical protein
MTCFVKSLPSGMSFREEASGISSITTATGESPAVKSQYVRFPGDSIRTSQANCVDGSALFASVLRRIGIDPVLVVIPGHCFLAFYLDRDQRTAAWLETTMLGSATLSQYPAENRVSGKLAHLFRPGN